jgi:hypothetical protein
MGQPRVELGGQSSVLASNIVVNRVEIPLCIREIQGSILGPGTGYSDGVSPGYYHDWPRPLPPTQFLLHYSDYPASYSVGPALESRSVDLLL